MIKFLSILISLLPCLGFAAEKVILYSDMVIRKCEINSFGEKACLGDFSHPKQISIDLNESQYFASGSWKQEYKIGSQVFIGKIDILKNLSDSTYLIQVQIQGSNFNPKTLVTLNDLKNPLSIDVKDDSVIIRDDAGQEWSPSLYIQVP